MRILQKQWCRKTVSIILSCLILIGVTAAAVTPALAAPKAGESIAIMGADLTETQRQDLLKEFGATDQTKILTVTNREEHQALDGVIPASEIGNSAFSSVMITFKDKGSGLQLRMSHITYVTPQSYADALTTLGITDAEIVISAPFDVSGTAALTGIMKGFEEVSGEKIDDSMKQAVNEEAITSTELTNDLAETYGAEKAQQIVTNIINNIKIEINNQNPQTQEEIEEIVRKVLAEQGITISDEDFAKLVDLFNKLKDLDVDWENVVNIIEEKGNDLFDALSNTLTSEQAKETTSAIARWFQKIIDWIKSLFH